jgi:alpha-tubulin suppressor-like RCC1 family protein
MMAPFGRGDQNSSGQLGTGNTSSATTPVQIAGITNAVSVVAGQYHSTAILSDGSVVAWGSNSYGQMGVTADLKTG